jgi:menaquinone-dependent protoporphyrinogen oxidase
MTGQRVLVAYGSKNGGTAGIAAIVGQTLRERGFEVDVRDAGEVRDVHAYGAVVLGGALYALRWHADAVRFARRHARALAGQPVWVFSSGPLDSSADEQDIPPVGGARRAMNLMAARQHRTFGGVLDEHAKGWLARRMVAAGNGGDFRSAKAIQQWAGEIADTLAEQDNRLAQG